MESLSFSNKNLTLNTIETIVSEVEKYVKSKNSIDLIVKSYELAKKQHEGQFRKSGDPYIQHPIEVAYMLACLKVSPETICAGFLHDVLEDTDITKEKIIKDFGTDVADIVDGVTKIGKLKYLTKERALAKTHQKILLAMAKDIRVILVKLIDRVHNMRTLEFQPHDKQVKIAQETLELYAPLAHRIGMYRVKAELEDTAFKYIDPEKYEIINNELITEKKAHEEDINSMKEIIKNQLVNANITSYEIKGRVKNIYSINGKMLKKSLELNQIYDLMALRVIVPTIEDCYRVLGLVHGRWNPLPGRFKDYIATPKPNLYQSLHTTILGEKGKIYEIQIRTYEMDNIAEYGIAAHWSYKEGSSGYSAEKAQEEVKAKLKWYRDLLTYVEIGESDDVDPLLNIKEDIFSANVYVFTPKGDVMDFPTGATPLDFAYRVHTEVGNKAVGAIINGKIVPLTYRLKTGDVVEIKTNKNFNGPTEAWLKIVKTTHAKHKISSILNKQKRDQLIIDGKDEFERVAKAVNFTTKLTDKLIVENFSKLNINSLDDFYCEVGKNSISAKAAINKMQGVNEKVSEEDLIKHYNQRSLSQSHKPSNDFGVYIEGLDKAQIKLANCCHPVYGDNIVGYVSKGNGIIVHRYECHNNVNSQNNRFIDVFWDNQITNKRYDSQLSILSYDRPNIVADIINVFNSHAQVTIKAISSTHNRSGELLTKVKLTVDNVDTLNNIIINLLKIHDVYTAERVIK